MTFFFSILMYVDPCRLNNSGFMYFVCLFVIISLGSPFLLECDRLLRVCVQWDFEFTLWLTLRVGAAWA